jgi:hypothetical protein
MYSPISAAERPVAARISATLAPRAYKAAIWRKSARYRRIDPSECAVRRSMSVNCRPHRYSCTTLALWEMPGPMSRSCPRVGTAWSLRRSQARSRFTVAGDEQVSQARSSTVSSAPCTRAWRASRARRACRIAANPWRRSVSMSSGAASSRRIWTLRQAAIGLPAGSSASTAR